MGWRLYPALAEEPKYIVVGTPRPYLGSPYYPQRRPTCPWLSSAVWPPFKGPPHPPPLPAFSFPSSSQGWGAGKLWLQEEEGEQGE